MYFLFLSSFLTNSERSGELEENEDKKKNHTCVNGVSHTIRLVGARWLSRADATARDEAPPAQQ